MSKKPVALQLYSVRGECPKDLVGTFRQIRETGFDAVEPWGYDGSKPEWMGFSAGQLRTMLDDSGLACCGMHLGTCALQGDNLERTIELNRELGNRFLVIAGDAGRTASEAGVRELAGILAAAAEKLKPHGMQAGYHAHPFDFTRFGEGTAWDLLFTITPAEVVMQLDIGNSANGGADPVDILRRFPGRARTVHLKEYGGPDGSVIGEGKADWSEIFRLCESAHKTEWYVIEEGGPDGMGFDVCRRSLENLRGLGL